MAKLKRALSLFEATVCGVGIILGAGIYALIGEGAALAGPSLWLSFLIAAFVALFSALSYAELSSMFPKAGGGYEYVRNAFGKGLAFQVGWLIAISAIISAITVTIGFSNYFSKLVGAPSWVGYTLIVSLSTFLLLMGIKESATAGIIATAIEGGGLLIIIALAIPYLGSANYMELPNGISGLLAASAIIFFAYLGFEDLVRLAEEVKQPKVNMPRAVLISVLITTLLYILVSIAAVSVISWEELGSSKAPLAKVAGKEFGHSAYTLLSIVALFATGNTILFMLLAGSRLLYGMAATGALTKRLAYINKKGVPVYATLLVCGTTYLFSFVGDIKLVASITNLILFFSFAMVNASVIVLRYKLPRAERPFRIPFTVNKVPIPALLGFISSLLLIVNIELEALPYGILLLLIGTLLYGFKKRKKSHVEEAYKV